MYPYGRMSHLTVCGTYLLRRTYFILCFISVISNFVPRYYHYSSHDLANASCVAFQPCKLEILIDTCILLEYWCVGRTTGGINKLTEPMKQIQDALTDPLEAFANFNKVIFKIY